jgi:Sec-independent protein translocase protein TatA
MGRKAFSAGTIGRASTTMRTGMRTAKEHSDIAAASENLEALQQQKAELEAEFNAEMQALEGSTDPLKQSIETVAQRPKKADVSVRMVALVWLPHWKTPEGSIHPAY